MSNVTSTAPAVYAAFYNLVSAAAAAQTPAVPVLVGDLEQYEPATFVLITGLENHIYTTEALNYSAFLEEYDICGIVSVVQGDVDPVTVNAATYAVYQSVVMATVVANAGMAGSGVLGVPAASGGPNSIVPGYARYTATPGNFGGGQAGFQGTITWSYRVQGYLTRS